MANLFMDSCSHYSNAQVQSKYNFNSAAFCTVGATYALGAASQGMRIASAFAGRNIPNCLGGCLGFRFKLVSTSNGVFTDWARFLDNGTVHCSMTWNASGTLTIKRGATVLGTSSLTVALNQVHYCELLFTAHNSTGIFSVYIDGVLFVTFSGDTSSTANNFFNQFTIGDGGSGIHEIWFSDIYLNDNTATAPVGRVGDCSITPKTVVSAGTHADFGRGGTDTGTNAGQLAKALADATSFTRDNVLNHRDSFHMTALAAGTVLGARLWAWAQKDGSGARSIGLTITDSTDDIGPDIPLASGGYQFYDRDASIDPNTSAVWASFGALNGAQMGYKIKV